jgi:predicted Zn-dependent peptidase
MYQKTTLENGIRVVTEAMPEARSLALGILVAASPRDEAMEQGGLAHMVEHLMFQGTSSRDAMQIARLMDTAGGHLGAFTSRDYTCYYATVLDDYRTYALDLLGDVLLNSIFPLEALDRARETILHEIEEGNDSPDERLNDLLKATIWPGHPLGRPTAGLAADVRRIRRDDIIYFVHENYLPDRIIIAAAGHVEHADFVAQVRDAFWRMIGQSTPRPIQAPAYQNAVAVEYMPVSQAYFSIGLQAPAYTHASRYGVHLLSNVLGGGISSRLFRRIREERGLVYRIGSDYHAYEEAGLFVVEGSTTPEKLITVLTLTLIELWQFLSAEEPVSAEELWKAKLQLRAQHLITGESTHTRMSRLATQEFYFGKPISSEEVIAQIEQVNQLTLQQIAEELLLPALPRLTLTVVGPKAPEFYSVTAVKDLLAIF